MTFQSFEYAALLLAVFTAYWFLPRRGQNALLLIASYVFYAYVDPRLALLLGGYTIVNYLAARAIDSDRKHARRYLVLAVLASLGALGFFKYAGFFVSNMAIVLDSIGLASFDSTLKIILPVGISFYTFQSLGYVIDVYVGRTHVRRDFADTALFIGFFPQLVAGPIERASNLLPQFERSRKFRPDQVASGLSLLTWGLFKKLVIADNVGVIVDRIFSTSEPGAAMLCLRLEFKSSPISPATQISPAARHACWALTCHLTSGTHGSHRRLPTSGDAGTLRCRPGCATTSISRSAATGQAAVGSLSTW